MALDRLDAMTGAAAAKGNAMIGRRLVFVVFAIATAGCGKIERHYRIDVTINTPHGPRSGHSVIAFRAWDLDRTNGPRRPEVEGEAVPVEISKGRYVFMPVDRPGLGWGVLGPWVENRNAPALEAGASIAMERRSVPGFAMFKNLTDPRTVREVDFDHPEKSIGSGYSLRSITIARTDDPITRRIADLLPWVDSEARQIIDPDPRDSGTFENTLWTSAFKRRK